jgi:23S rRNA U2552 (ribose-2'-O)-methylase RlmE/FtsJ
VASLGIDKPIHIGETGWATISNGLYGRNGSHAADEYKQALYFKYMREWTTKNNISCFFFEAFDEKWKDAVNSKGSENHFGLFTIDGKAKFALWDSVDAGIFSALTRNGNAIGKTFRGSKENLLISVMPPVILETEITQ